MQIYGDIVEYLPAMNATATELTTVNEIFITVRDYQKAAKLATDPVCNGQSSLCRNHLKHCNLFANFLLRLGTRDDLQPAVHIRKTVWRCFLCDICIESGKIY